VKIIMFSMAIIYVLGGCVDMDSLNVRPSKTSITYGETNTTNDTVKDAKNDSTTTADSAKKSWTIKQEFTWGKYK
jgi:hypothetical protein